MCLDSECERIQRIVLATSGSEPIAKAQKLRLVDWREDCHHRRLQDFVLNRGDAERPLLLAVCLRYVPPARWQRSVLPCMYPCVEIGEVGLKIYRVLIPRHPVDAWCRVLLQTEEAPPQDVYVDVVQERCELFL